MLDKQLLDILACPKCKGDLTYETDQGNDKNGRLICSACKLVYRVEDDIPIMLIDEAEVISPCLTHLLFDLDCSEDLIGANSTKSGADCTVSSVEN